MLDISHPDFLLIEFGEDIGFAGINEDVFGRQHIGIDLEPLIDFSPLFTSLQPDPALSIEAPQNNTGPDPLDALRWGSVLDGASNPGTLVIPYYLQPALDDWVQIEFLQVHALDWDAYEQQQVRLAFDVIETYIDVEFVEVFSAQEAVFNLGVMSSLVFSFVLGRMVPPGEEDAGFGFFNRRGSGWDRDGDGGLEVGGSAFEVIIHEIGHGLGLAHPHDDGGTSTMLQGVESSSDTGDFDLNQGVFTIMSYNDGWALGPAGEPDSQAYGYNASFGPLDIAVLQELYGANPTAGGGDNVYTLPDIAGPGSYFSSIWDVGGTDTIMATGSAGAVINLNDASLQYEVGGGGHVSYNSGVQGGFTISNGVVIENAVGADGADQLIGNAANNVLRGGAGVDMLSGGGGADRLIGGLGDDELFGDGGADTFVFAAFGGTDRIMDFENGVDQIEFHNSASGYNGLSFKQDGNDVVIKSGTGLIILANTNLSEIDITDFRFRQDAESQTDPLKISTEMDNIVDQLIAIAAPEPFSGDKFVPEYEPLFTDMDFIL